MTERADQVTMATEMTTAWLNNPHTRASADEIASFLETIHKTVSELGQPAAPAPESTSPTAYEPAISARRSLASPEHIVSMIDGKKYKTLRRHLSANGLTPDEYRQRYGLKPDYPMVAPAYTESRRTLSKALGLGRKAGTKVEAATESAVASVRKSGKAALAAAKKALGSGD